MIYECESLLECLLAIARLIKVFDEHENINSINGNTSHRNSRLIPMAQAHKSRKSIAATPEGKRKLREAQNLSSGKRITYEDIEEILDFQVSRSTIERFFRGKAVDIDNAISITQVLRLKLEDVVDVVIYKKMTLR